MIIYDNQWDTNTFTVLINSLIIIIVDHVTYDQSDLYK